MDGPQAGPFLLICKSKLILCSPILCRAPALPEVMTGGKPRFASATARSDERVRGVLTRAQLRLLVECYCARRMPPNVPEKLQSWFWPLMRAVKPLIVGFISTALKLPLISEAQL